MKNKLKLLTITALLSLSLWSSNAIAGISGSKHDLGSGGASQYGGTAGTTQVCVFCHTPHGSDTDAAIPLWNKALPTSTYTAYSSLGTSTLDGEETTIGSVSLACLSCHDGSQAQDVMINAPGSGNYNASGASAYALAAMTGTPIPVVGTDLSNDHPISIQYGGGGLASTDADGTYTSADFGDADFNDVQKATINGNAAWWVDDGDTNREKTEMQLYTRVMGGVTQPFVECASCHDPHNGSTATFLRVANTGSAVCLACHNK